MKNNYPKVIVLILSYNGKQLLDDSVTSYLANDYPNFEVVVIDNGSNDGSAEYVKLHYPKAKIISIEKNRGYSGGFNFGLEYAFKNQNADYVVVTNNDVKVDTKVISSLVKIARKDEMTGFVTGKVYYFDKPDTLQTVGKKEHPIYWSGGHIGNREKDIGQFDNIEERFFADDIFTLVSRKLYNDIGAYDENFQFQSEEFDWQARAKEKDFKIMYTPGAKIWHKDSMTIGKQSAFKAYFDARNPMIVILKYKSADFFRRYFWQHFKLGVFRNSLVRIKKLRPHVAWNIWMGFFSGMIWGFKHRKFTKKHFMGF